MSRTDAGPSSSGVGVLLPVLLDGARNRARRFLARLRDPRYAAALVAGLLYFGWIFLAPGGSPGETAPEELGRLLGRLRGTAPFLLAALIGFWWVRGGFERALAFTPAEVQFFFPAPLARRTLLRYRLLKLQGGVLFTATLLSLVPRGGLPWPARLATWWLLVTTLHLHQLAASLTRDAALRGEGGRRPVWVPLALLGLAVVGLAATLWTALPELRGAGDVEGALAVLARTLERPVPRAALLPLEAVLAPVFAPALGPWLRSLPPAVVVLVLHYVWVVTVGTGFEEAAARGGRQRERRRSAGPGRLGQVAGGRTGPVAPSPLPLAPLGEPAVAILWKNVTAFLRESRRWTVAILALGGVGLFTGLAAVTGSWRAAASGMAGVLALTAGGLAILGPLAFRYDLRRDLERVELLRTLPVRGPRLVAAEVGAAALCLTGTQAAALLAAGAFAAFVPELPAPRPWLFAAGGGALVFLAPLNVVTLSIQNGLALLFPDWVRIGRESPGGVDHAGQNLLTLVAALLLTGLALLPVLLVAGVTALSAAPLLGPWAALPAALTGLATLCAEAAGGIRWLGRRWDALEPDAHGLL